MRYIKWWLFILCIFIKSKEILIINTGFNDPYYYTTMENIIQSYGFNTHIVSWYQLNQTDYKSASIIYLELNNNILSSLSSQKKDPLSLKIRELLMPLFEEIKITKKTIIFGVPPIINIKPTITQIKTILNLIESHVPLSLHYLLAHLMKQNAQKSYGYDTALLTKKENAGNKITLKFLEGITLLPSNQEKIPLALNSLYPFAGYYLMKDDQVISFISTEYLHALDMMEQFTLYPLNPSLYQAYIKMLMQTLYELLISPKKPQKNLIPPLLPEFTLQYAYTQKKQAQQDRKHCLDKSHTWLNNNPTSIAWMHLHTFKKFSNVKDQIAIAQRILKSNVNILWLELAPEMYLSDHAINSDKEKNEKLNLIKSFTNALKIAHQKSTSLIPMLMLGLELTWNYANIPPHVTAIDIEGNNYPHIPSPLDYDQFWQTEIVDVVNRFVKLWNLQIGNGIPLSGVFLDLEMYHAQQETGQFLNTMDFSDIAWNIFAQTYNRKLISLKNHPQRIAYLLSNNLLNTYFSILQSRAVQIGKAVAESIRKIIPNALIGVYNITLPYNWFYQGLLQGLSSCKYPIVYASFNINAYRHYHWAHKHNLYFFHYAPIMLSKLRNQKDFSLIPYLSTFNDGIWLNRFSQLEEPTKDYMNVEVSPLKTTEIIKQLSDML